MIHLKIIWSDFVSIFLTLLYSLIEQKLENISIWWRILSKIQLRYTLRYFLTAFVLIHFIGIYFRLFAACVFLMFLTNQIHFSVFYTSCKSAFEVIHLRFHMDLPKINPFWIQFLRSGAIHSSNFDQLVILTSWLSAKCELNPLIAISKININQQNSSCAVLKYSLVEHDIFCHQHEASETSSPTSLYLAIMIQTFWVMYPR